MAIKTKNWSTGTGSVTIQYGGQGDGEIIVTSDANSLYEARSMQIAIETTDGSGISRNISINQTAKQRIDLSTDGLLQVRNTIIYGKLYSSVGAIGRLALSNNSLYNLMM